MFYFSWGIWKPKICVSAELILETLKKNPFHVSLLTSSDGCWQSLMCLGLSLLRYLPLSLHHLPLYDSLLVRTPVIAIDHTINPEWFLLKILNLLCLQGTFFQRRSHSNVPIVHKVWRNSIQLTTDSFYCFSFQGQSFLIVTSNNLYSKINNSVLHFYSSKICVTIRASNQH